MIFESPKVDLAWLAKRCAMLNPLVRQPSRRAIDALQRALPEDVLELADEGEGLAQLQDTLLMLFDSLGLDAPEWREAPVRDALPMLALIPGVGCRIVYARTPEGNWLVEGATGSQEFYHLPEGGLYAAIVAPRASEKDASTARTMFRQVLTRAEY